MTNEELIEQLEKAASNLSYFNAAEGDSWNKEREARLTAYAEFCRVRELCEIANIDIKPILRGYLI